jgi:hypothetical protein
MIKVLIFVLSCWIVGWNIGEWIGERFLNDR